MESAKLVFIDESSAKTNMTRLYGRAARSERCHAHAPHGHWCSTTMISSVRLDASTAPMVIEGATNAEVFLTYAKTFLAPVLKAGDIVIMDNLSSHKDSRVIAAIEATGASVRFLPAYSPDLNPIEKMWSKVKGILRSLQARTRETLTTAIATALSQVRPLDVQGWFKSCGYIIN